MAPGRRDCVHRDEYIVLVSYWEGVPYNLDAKVCLLCGRVKVLYDQCLKMLEEVNKRGQ